MKINKQKLELTWIGKQDKPKLEARILIEDPEKSYGDKNTENKLIHGDNLLSLRALEQNYSDRIKCIYIDPPFNTGSAFDHYDDTLEHSIWLSLMQSRFEIFRKLLRDDGVLFLHLDDSEMAYAKVLLDEIFGRKNYCNTITLTTNDPSGFKATGSTVFSTANYLLVYAKDKSKKPIEKVYIEKSYDKAYSKVLVDRSVNYQNWKWENISDVVGRELGFASSREAKRELGDGFHTAIAKYALDNADRVFRVAAIGGGAAIKRAETIKRSIQNKDQVIIHPDEDVEDFYILNGGQILFYDKRLIEVDGKKLPGEVITDVWTDISWTGIANEGGVEFKNGKKPELLISRVLQMSTKEGDWVLDSFLGSGTTAAVAQKLKRRWIGIEIGDHCDSHCLPRLKSVCNGSDNTGITKSISWTGGGGFKYYYLAPSLLQKDKRGNWIINKQYNATQLAAAMAKHEGFRFEPDDTYYWKQGKSTERDFIFTTTNFISVKLVDTIYSEMKNDESLLICCTSFSRAADKYPNITIKKIPKMLLGRCEFGKEDYSLNIVNVPTLSEEQEFIPKGPVKSSDKSKKRRTVSATDDLFSQEKGDRK